MSRPRLPIGLLLPALLVGLVALLATLQYRWLGKVSEAEREQLSRALTQRARDLTEDFDREITGLYLALQAAGPGAAAHDGNAVAGALDRWRGSARHPQMVRGVYLADWADGHLQIRPFHPDTNVLAGAPLAAWPPRLEPVRRQLSAGPPTAPLPAPLPRPSPRNGNLQFITFSLSPVVPEVPALVVPLASPFAGAAGAATTIAPGIAATRSAGDPGTLRWVDEMRSSLVVDLDGEYLAKTMVASLADRYFPAGGPGGYRLAVVSASGAPMFQRGFPPGTRVDPDRADVVMPFFALRLDLAAAIRSSDARGPAHSAPTAAPVTIVETRTDGTAAQGAGGASGGHSSARISVLMDSGTPGIQGGAVSAMRARVVPSRPGWRLLLQHGAGSLDAAVSQARRRNLWLSFSILGVLAAGVVLVVVNARRSEQLAARHMDFVATVSHELRTPLAVIRSAAQNLSAGVVADPAQARRYGELIDSEGRRLTDMVEQVLDYAGLEGQGRVRAPRPVDIPTLVEEVAASCRPACEAAGCVLDVDLGGPEFEVPPVMGDEAALGRVVHNLVTNAAKHGADGHWVGVRVSSCPVRGGREVQITVNDRGRGIDAADLAHVFEPFRRGRHAIEQQVHGNGLGLSLVRRIVEAHGGRVAVTSAPGEGATFAVYLPADPASGTGETASDT